MRLKQCKLNDTLCHFAPFHECNIVIVMWASPLPAKSFGPSLAPKFYANISINIENDYTSSIQAS